MLLGIILIVLVFLIFILYCSVVVAGRYDRCCYDMEQEKSLAEYMEEQERD